MPRNSGGSVNRREFLTISGTVLGGVAAGATVTVAESKNRFIVDTKGKADLSDVEVIHDLDSIDVAVVRGSESDLEKSVKSFEPDSVLKLDKPFEGKVQAQSSDASASSDGDAGTESDDSALLYPAQWDKQAQDLGDVHDITEGDGSRVSVIDTGVDATHPDLAAAVNENLSANFTDDGGDYTDVHYHGTHVSGIVAAQGLGVTGTAPDTDLVACRVFEATGGATFGDILAAIEHSVEVGCDAANLSLGAYPISREGLGDFYGKVLNRATTHANKEGTLLVSAAGNDEADLQHDGDVIALPTEGAQVSSISATATEGFSPLTGDADDPADTPANYTNYGSNVINISAPGGDFDESIFDGVLSTIPIRFILPWAYLPGTSMAAPQVTGAVALMKSQDPNLNANQVESILQRTADPGTGDDAYHGKGFIDLLEAVDTAGKGGGGGNGK